MLLWQAARQYAEELGKFFDPARSHGLDGLTRLAQDKFEATVLVTKLSQGISGFIFKEEGGTPEIYINLSEPPVRQRFTLAHEIGHLIERIEVAKDYDFSFMDYRRPDPNDYNFHEFFADEFAGALLMPEEPLMKIVNEIGEYAAADKFNVSVPAVRKRLVRIEKHKDHSAEAR